MQPLDEQRRVIEVTQAVQGSAMTDGGKLALERKIQTKGVAEAIGRRTFAAGALALAVAPGGAWAQVPDRKRRVGFVAPGIATLPIMTDIVASFLKGMAELGWTEGRDFELVARYGEFREDRLRAVLRELIALAPDVIVATGQPVHIIAHEETKTIPIVFNTGGDPVLLGLAESHNRPGGNVTGVMSTLTDGFMPKRLQFCSELLPGSTRVGMPFNPNNPGHLPYRRAAEDAAAQLKLNLIFVETRTAADFDAAFAQFKAARAEIVLPIVDALYLGNSSRMGALAAAAGLPWVDGYREQVRDGAILAYGANLLANQRRGAYFVDRILRGLKPGNLPIEFPTVFDVAVNLKIAKALGVKVPETIMIFATEVIE